MAARKSGYSTTALREWSGLIAERVERDELFRNASCVALYHALPGEVQTAELIERWADRKRILLPLVAGNDLRLLRYDGPRSLHVGAYGILEPRPDGEEPPLEEIDLIIVPGVAFDRERNRMGRGKGFYDRLLSTLDAPRIGLCYDFQLVEQVPVEPFDKRMDRIITERESIG